MENIVSVDGLNIDLPDRRLFENLAFDIPRGALTCITGENGVGKTTLVKHLLRDLKMPWARSMMATSGNFTVTNAALIVPCRSAVS